MKNHPLILLLFIGNLLFSQTFEPVVPPDNIGGVVLFNPNTNDNTPIIELGEQLILKFDDLDGIYKRYNYTIERYTHDWQPTNAFRNDYMIGFKQDFISDYKQSFNTSSNYTHYNLIFPNNKIGIKLSGNYVIKVFQTNPRKPIITKRFAVYESGAGLQTLVSQGRTQTNETQTVSFDAIYNSQRFDLTRNIQDVWGTIIKNNNWNDALYNLAPDFVNDQKLTFNSIDYTFWAGNEYRWLDTKKRDAKALTTDHIDHDSIYHHYLMIDQPRAFSGYINEPDYEGGYYIRTVDQLAEDNIDTQADYIDVHFAFESFNPKNDVDIYVTGAFNDWQLSEQNKMVFDKENRYYKLNMLLKQGTYNYQYTFTKKGTHEIIFEEPEGNYWQTTNFYSTLLYYRPWGQRYDLLIGMGRVLSRE
ncbi:hypothetical protein UJ101_00461 [Flavobacteriaceae bacterium UJ101]|nr:hypothetical protein UJ101_00461 [Flavobacteriaceae bacterium UJ101]